MDVQPFTIQVADDVLADLRRRIAAARWPDEVADAGWDYGTSPDYLRALLDAWAGDFDWRARERELNGLDHYQVEIEGLPIHFVHRRGRGPSPLPIVLTHGWPSSFLESRKLLPLLADPAASGGNPADAFDVVVPSLPGYGFSGRPTRPGMTSETVARLWKTLMTDVLGYDRFAAHGTDIGAGVSRYLGARFPTRVVGVHLSAAAFDLPAEPADPPLTAAERAFAAQVARWKAAEGAYGDIQGTKPQTLSYGLTDSPAGLAAWIVEKWRAWSDCGGDLESRFTRDEILTNLTVYWATATIGSSIRMYYERRHHAPPPGRVEVPVGVALFPNEFVPLPSPPRELVERTHNVARWTTHGRGGHFPAMEEPETLAADLRAFFRGLR